MKLSQLIRDYRRTHKISLRKLAAEIGIDHAMLARFEGGKTSGMKLEGINKIICWLFK